MWISCVQHCSFMTSIDCFTILVYPLSLWNCIVIETSCVTHCFHILHLGKSVLSLSLHWSFYFLKVGYSLHVWICISIFSCHKWFPIVRVMLLSPHLVHYLFQRSQCCKFCISIITFSQFIISVFPAFG